MFVITDVIVELKPIFLLMIMDKFSQVAKSQNGLVCSLAIRYSTLAPGETIEATQEFYLPTNGLNDHVYAKVTFQKIIDTDARKPMSPIEVQIDIDGFQDDEPFTLVNKSELSVEQKLLIEKWKRTKGVYRLDDLYVIAAGWQPNPGYGLEIVKTEISWEQVTVYVGVTKPNSGNKNSGDFLSIYHWKNESRSLYKSSLCRC